MKVSILMASYNPQEEYLVIAVRSILEQSFRDFEFIIVDDGSNPSIESILSRCGIHDARIHIVRSATNLGLPKALNLGLQHCSGDYIARMDDDDISMPDRIEKQIHYLEHGGRFDGCWTGFDAIDAKGRFLFSSLKRLKPEMLLRFLITRGNCLCHSTLFVKHTILVQIGGYDPNLRYSQDYDLNIRLLERFNMGYIDQSLLHFRKTSIRQNVYRKCLSESYAFFSRYWFYMRNQKTMRYKLWFYLGLLRLCLQMLFLHRKAIEER